MIRTFSYVAITAAALAILLAPALINGGPIYWHDSLSHLHGGSSALNVTTGLETRYSEMERAILPDPGSAPEKPATARGTGGPSPTSDAEYMISAARSPYYSVALTFISALGGPLAPVVVQALLVLATGIFLLRAVFRGQLARPALYLLAAASVTTIGIFSTILLPDILAPLGILSAAVLFSFYDRLAGLDKLFWFTVLVVSVISHTSHLAVAALFVPVGIIVAKLTRRDRVIAPAAVVAAGVAVGIFSIFIFSQTIQKVYGYKPRPLPMVAASIIIDGPGLSYLRATCPENGYVYCQHLHTKATSVDQYLWFKNKDIGVFRNADPKSREQMSDQQFQFLLDTLRFDFAGQFSASMRRFLAQLSENSLDHLTYTDRLKLELSSRLPEPDRRRALESAAYRGAFPFAWAGMFAQITAFASLAALLIIVQVVGRQGNSHIPGERDDAPMGALVAFTVLVIGGMIANAGITGVASNPQGRYGARVLLLLPLLLAVWAAWRVRSSDRNPIGDSFTTSET